MTSLPLDFEWSGGPVRHYVPGVLRWIASLGDTLVIGLAIQLTLSRSSATSSRWSRGAAP
jgi:hypothetical protein